MKPASYPKPPIEQAILDIRWQASLKESLLRKAAGKLSKDYPLDQNEIKLEVSIQGEVAKVGQNIEGHRLQSKDDLGVVLLRPKSLTVARFAPYGGWSAFQAEAKLVWGKVKKVIKHQKLERIAIRFINRIDIPFIENDKQKIIEEKDFLNVGVLLPVDTPVMKGYLARFSIELREGIFANISSGTVPSPVLDHLSIMLDIDVFNEGHVTQNEKDLWLMFEELRKQKNILFEKYITDKSRELFMAKED